MAKLMLSFVAMATFLVATCVSADDSNPINDFCVADLKMDVMFNGIACKSPKMVTPEDFKFTGFRATADTNNSMGIGIIPAFAAVNYPALNTQGFSLAKINYAKNGLVTPHTHPRAAEVITVTKGEIYAGFVCTSGKLWAVTLKVGDFFVFPKGLVHFHVNVANGSAATLSVMNAQNPGIQMVANALFGSTPPIKSAVLTKAFTISNETSDWIRRNFPPSPM
ncbi:hypothetical protein KC19_10G080100 [Ceratodon purpureus]|uniref:Germin-like protein n=1 Tax=Ceratodon purpureus TaxID=3225 RepID=A0A8T0GI09_CERPU|nr:hypothetical protein KC19_10G080100 [Ceratodon purpureus]